MKKTLNRIGSILGFVIILFFLYSLIHDLICDTKETLIRIGEGVAFVIVVLGIIWLHLTLEDKNHIDWDNHRELRTICRWLCFSSWALFGVAIQEVILQIDNSSISIFPFLLPVLSFWTYLSLIFAKRNALLLLRSFLIFMLIFWLRGVVNICTKSIEIHLESPFEWDIFFEFVFTVISGLILALFIKGLIMTFTPKIKNLFKNYHISYLNIAIITLICIGLFWMRNVTITFNHIENSSSEKIGAMK